MSFNPLFRTRHFPSPLFRHFARLTKELFDPGNDRPFKLSFTLLRAQFEEVEGVFIPNRQVGLIHDGIGQGLLEVGLAQHGLFIGLILDSKCRPFSVQLNLPVMRMSKSHSRWFFQRPMMRRCFDQLISLIIG
jgi:hypothetical protein